MDLAEQTQKARSLSSHAVAQICLSYPTWKYLGDLQRKSELRRVDFIFTLAWLTLFCWSAWHWATEGLSVVLVLIASVMVVIHVGIFISSYFFYRPWYERALNEYMKGHEEARTMSHKGGHLRANLEMAFNFIKIYEPGLIKVIADIEERLDAPPQNHP